MVWKVTKGAHDAVGHLAGGGVPVAAQTDGQEVAGAAQLILVLDQAMRPPDHLPEAAALKKPKLPVNLLREAEQIAMIQLHKGHKGSFPQIAKRRPPGR